MAGGTGSRLWPMTAGTSKQLLPIFNKPMVFYSLSTLLLAGVREIVVVADPLHIDSFRRLLGSGEDFGCDLTFVTQKDPLGIAHGITLVPPALRGGPLALSLGDNIFFGSGVGTSLSRNDISGAEAFASPVSNPSEFGVVELNREGKPIAISEKPSQPKSNLAVVGFYILDDTAYGRVGKVKPSARGELEITALLSDYLADGCLKVNKLPRGTAWLDTGKAQSLARASQFVEAVEENQGLLIGSPHEIAWRMGWVASDRVEKTARKFKGSDYASKLLSLIE